MKQLLILSGKGGTGKTTVAGAFIALSHGKAFADCDVDAPNLHLVMHGLTIAEKNDYYGFEKAEIGRDKCIHCGLCEESCCFDAIKNFSVGEFECEGCGVCAEICPENAISMRENITGQMMLYKDNQKVFSTAHLKIGSGASGKLVTAVKQQLKKEASGADFSIIDGSPRIGCPVIASISGVDFVLIVSEPTISGMHDMKRIVETCRHFGVRCAVCINKYDVNTDVADEIEEYCESMALPVAGRIPYDETVVKAINKCQSIAEYPNSPAGIAVKAVWDNISDILLSK
ncbi:MAG: ATP-binding protein [Clostridiaceae bacterium]|nr:ATP-binding protein [Clostridiaceae bacterium]